MYSKYRPTYTGGDLARRSMDESLGLVQFDGSRTHESSAIQQTLLLSFMI